MLTVFANTFMTATRQQPFGKKKHDDFPPFRLDRRDLRTLKRKANGHD